jgi:putative membrane protein
MRRKQMAKRKDILSLVGLLPWSKGAIAGAAATIPMTAFMLAMQRNLPKDQRYELPPEKITKEIADRTNVSEHMNKQQQVGASLLSHLGYGASMGSIYAPIARRVPLSPLIKGTLFGLVIWAVSYLGWMPAVKFSTSATEEPANRNLLMIGAHIIWGSATGVVMNLLEDQG